MKTPQAGSILVGLLWCVALLSLLVIGVLHTATVDLKVTKNYEDRIQAHYLALAGIEKAKAVIYQNTRERSRAAQNHNNECYNNPQAFRDVALGRGHFQVFRRGRQDEGGGVIYGVSDEESRLNVNLAATNMLDKLHDMTPDIVAAIVDWRSPGNQITPGGARADYYESLRPPYEPRNGPLLTVRELLMVRGVTPSLLAGSDTHQNGFFERDEDLGASSGRGADVSADIDSGWAGLVTVDSRVDNVNASGQDRVNVQTADQSTLATVRGITPNMASAIVSYRGQNQFQSIANLLDVTPQQNSGTPGGTGARGGTQTASSGGGGVIDRNQFMELADDVTVEDDRQLPGKININTAGVDVLACVPGIDRNLAQAIISYRQSNGSYANVGGLLDVTGMTVDLFKQAAPYVTARSETYRIFSEGKVDSTGVRQRIQAIVHIGFSDVTTLSWREDDL